MSGIRRELQRTAAALPMPALKACEGGARVPVALAREEHRPYESPVLDIFQMEVESVGLGSDRDELSDRRGLVSDSCSEASTESSVMLAFCVVLPGASRDPQRGRRCRRHPTEVGSKAWQVRPWPRKGTGNGGGPTTVVGTTRRELKCCISCPGRLNKLLLVHP